MSEEVYTGEITDLAFGGEGVLRKDGMVTFVPFTAVGDVIKCQITQKKSSFAKGILTEIIKPSPTRVKAPCPYFGTCGGCQLQHISYTEQLEQKRKWVEDALKRIGHLSFPVNPVVAATQQWTYRRHIHLSLRPYEGVFQAGYTAIDNKTLLPIMQCQIFLPPDNEIFAQIHKTVAKISSHGNQEGKITILKQGDNTFLLCFHFKHLPQNIVKVIENAMSHFSNWTTVVISTLHKTLEFGPKPPPTDVLGLKIAYSPRAFMQNHPEQSANIYQELQRISQHIKPRKIIDLYCGIGISSILLAKDGSSVIGVEYNREAIQLAKQNAKNNNIFKIKFVQGDVNLLLKDLLKHEKPDLVIVNPPREGLDKTVVEALMKYPPKHILYISCMPSTLARDLNGLSNHYKIQSCQPYDMFPQTAHIETLVHLSSPQAIAEQVNF